MFRAPRVELHTAVAIDAANRKERSGMSRNISRTGMLFHSGSQFAVGEKLSLRFQMGTAVEGQENFISATVVRAESEPVSKHNFLRFVTAVHFETPLPSIGVAEL
jgi:hypothetical protein